MRFLRVTIVSLMPIFLVGIARAQSSLVSGHVYDSEGHPLVGARVIPFPLEVGMSGPLPFAVSAADGSYRLTLPAFGKTRICASKEGAGYPDTTSAIFLSGKENEPVVNLVAETHLHDIDIRLPPPDGSLDLTVTDKSSGLAIPNARITLRRDEDPSVMYATGIGDTGHFYIELPNRPIQIFVTAGGYQDARYKDPITGDQFIKILPHQHKVIAVQLSAIPKG
jgi:hypothetical protein